VSWRASLARVAPPRQVNGAHWRTTAQGNAAHGNVEDLKTDRVGGRNGAREDRRTNSHSGWAMDICTQGILSGPLSGDVGRRHFIGERGYSLTVWVRIHGMGAVSANSDQFNERAQNYLPSQSPILRLVSLCNRVPVHHSPNCLEIVGLDVEILRSGTCRHECTCR
jgi:hypothetical protein